MITVNKIQDNGQTPYLEMYGLSTDTKPTDMIGSAKIINGSTFYCMDTKEAFVFSEGNSTWYKV